MSSALSLFFSLDEQSAKLLVNKCFVPSVVEQAFNLQEADSTEDAWCYRLAGSEDVIATLPRKFDGNVSVVATAIKDMAAALNAAPMFMLVVLVSGAACINTQRKMAAE